MQIDIRVETGLGVITVRLLPCHRVHSLLSEYPAEQHHLRDEVRSAIQGWATRVEAQALDGPSRPG